MQELQWEKALLKQDPFLVEAPAQEFTTIWADSERLKDRLSTLISDFASSGVTQVILNRGSWGSGKTHSARYFTSRESLSALMPTVANVKGLYLRLPKEGVIAVREFFETSLEEMGWDEIKGALAEIVERLGPERAEREFVGLTRDSDSGRVLARLGSARVNDYDLRRWLVSDQGLTRTELNNLRLVKNLRSGASLPRIQLLAAILRCYTGSISGEARGSPRGRIILWIDETEDLNFYSGATRRSMTSMWRDLVDLMPRGFILVMNYTPARGEGRDVRGLFGEALVSRLTATVEFEPLSVEDARIYVDELLNHRIYRKEDPQNQGLPRSFPFDPEALDQLIARFTTLTPRNLNIVCGQLVRNGLRNGDVDADSKLALNADQIAQGWQELESIVKREEELIA